MKRKIVISAICSTLLIVPSVVFASSTSVSATAECNQSALGEIAVSFTNQEASRSIDVMAQDEQTGRSLNLGTVNGHQTKTGVIVTGKSQLNDGTVDFQLTWSDAKDQHDMNKAGYTTIICHAPTLTPTHAPTASPSPKNTTTPTQGTVNSPTPTCTPTPTSKPSVTPTPTNVPTNTPTPKEIPVINVTNNNNPTMTNTNTITISNNQEIAVAPEIQASQLPSTGAESNLLLGLISLIPAGIGFRKFSKIG